MLFELTQGHIDLLRKAYIDWNYVETGAPSIDPKRPYGNSFVPGDVAEILGIDTPDEDDGGDIYADWCGEMLDIHYETRTALEIILSCQTFEPGLYEKENSYSSSWKRVKVNSNDKT